MVCTRVSFYETKFLFFSPVVVGWFKILRCVYPILFVYFVHALWWCIHRGEGRESKEARLVAICGMAIFLK